MSGRQVEPVADSGREAAVPISVVRYIVAEGLTNAVKHAHASAITVVVDLDATGTVLHLAVRDDGVGGASLTRGTGLIGLKDRAEALGGRVALDSPSGGGTTLRAELPLGEAARR